MTTDEFTSFVTELLRAELVYRGGRPEELLANLTPGRDGGRDALTTRSAALGDRDSLVPLGETVWQFKAEASAPTIDEMVEEMSKPHPVACLDRGGSFVFVAQQPSRDEDIVDDQLKGIAISNHYKADQVRFLSQHRLAEYAKPYSSLSLLAFLPLRPEGLEPFSVWNNDHESSPYASIVHVEDAERLVEALKERRFYIAVTGPTGVGKSRLVLEAVRAASLQACIVYARSPGEPLNRLITHLRSGRLPCTIVVDECTSAHAAVLREQLQNSSATLVTIGTVREGSATIAAAGDAQIRLAPLHRRIVAEALEHIQQLTPDLRAWVAANTGGFLKLARIVGDQLARNPPSALSLANIAAVQTVSDALLGILGNDKHRVELLKLVACFATVEHGKPDCELDLLASKLGMQPLTAERHFASARREHVLVDTGSYVYVTPDLLVFWLMRQFLTDHARSFAAWLPLFSDRLKGEHFRQLERMRASSEGTEWAGKLLESIDPFRDLLALRQPWAEEALLALGAANKQAATRYILRRRARDADLPARIGTSMTLQRLLFRLMRRAEEFGDLLDLLIDARESPGTPQYGELPDILKGMLIGTPVSSTLASYSQVLDAVELQLLKRATPMKVALLSALGLGMFSPTGDGFTEFDREPNDRGRPRATKDDFRRAIRILIAHLHDDSEEISRSVAEILVIQTRAIIRLGVGEDLLTSWDDLVTVSGSIGRLADQLDAVLQYDKLPDEVRERVTGLRDSLATDLQSRVRLSIETWKTVSNASRNAALEDLPSLAKEILALMPPARAQVFALFFEPWAKNPGQLVSAIAQQPGSAEAWPGFLEAGRRARNAWLCSLYLAGCREGTEPATPNALELLPADSDFSRQVAAEALVLSRVSPLEMEALSNGVRLGFIKPEWLRRSSMGRWNENQDVASLNLLLDSLLMLEDGAAIAIGIMHRMVESQQATDSALLVSALAASFDRVVGHDEWVWAQLARTAGKEHPSLLVGALVAAIRARGLQHVPDELGGIVASCCASVPELAESVLTLWNQYGHAITSTFREAIAANLSAARLAAWAGEEPARLRSLGRVVPRSNASLTVELVELLGESGVFASSLMASAASGSWAGNISGFFGARSEEWRQYATSASSSTPRFRRLAESLARSFDESRVRAEQEEADEEALER